MAVQNNVQFGADITELEQAAKDTIALLSQQQGAIVSLMTTQYEHNKQQDKYRATVKGVLDDGRQIIVQLKNENKAWETHKTIIKDVGDGYQTAAQKKKEAQRDLDKFMKDLNSRAEDVRKDQAPMPQQQGPSGFLTPAAFSRIAQATAFKDVLAFGQDQMKQAIDTAKDYQIQISLIRTVSQEANMSFGQWSKGIKEVSDLLGTDLVDTAKAAYDVIQSQVVVGPQTLDFLRASGQLARTTGVDIKVASDLLSSVIQGFEKSITEADHVAAVLFKTVELGRIQMNELSTTMGRVAPSANVLGISLEEVSASLSTLTRQGIKTSDATTLVTNVILKLAKPTEAMKDLMKSWGFETSEAAIKTLGFAGVLRKLSEATSGGKLGELSELFNELRGLRGAVGLTSAFDDFEKDLAKIDDAEKTFVKAQEIRAESSADKLTKFATNVKNVFAEEYGQVGLAIAEKIIGPMGSGENAARAFGTAVLVTTGTIAAGKAAMIAFSAIQSVYTASSLRAAQAAAGEAAAIEARNKALAMGATPAAADIAATNARTVAMANATLSQEAQRKSMVNSIGSMALLTAAVVGATQVWAAYTDKLAPAAYATEANLSRIGEAVRNISTEKVENVAQQQLRTFEKLVDVSFRAPKMAAAKGLREVTDQIKQLEEEAKGLSEELGISYKGYLDGLKGSIKDLNKDIEQSTRNIQKSKKEAMSYKDTLDQIVRDTQMKYATDQQKLDLTEQNIRRLKGEAETLFMKGDEESVASARRKYDEIARLISDNFDRVQDMNRESLEEFAKQNPGAGPQTLIVSTIPLQKRLNETLQERNRLEDMYVKAQEKSIKNKKDEVAAQTEEMRRLEIATKKLLEFQVFDKGGKVKEEFTTGGKYDEAKVKESLKGIQDEIIGIVGSPEKADAALKFYGDLYNRIDNIARLANAKTNEELFKQDQKRIIATQDEFLKAYRDAQDKIGKASAGAFGKGGALDMLGQDASSMKDFLDAGPGWQNKWLKVDNIKTSIESDKAKEEAIKQFQKFEELKDNIRKNATTVQGQLIPQAGSVEAASKQFDKFKDSVKEYIRLLGAKVNVDDPSSLGGVLLPGRDPNNPVRFGDVANDFTGQAQALKDAAKAADDQSGAIQKLQQQVLQFQKDAAIPLLMQFPELGDTGKKATKDIAEGVDAMTQSLNRAIEAAKELKMQLQTMPQGAGGVGNQEVSDEMVDGSYYASGGVMGFPGKPRGTDRIPVWMAPGEFIVNAKDTRRFYSQLVDINRGKQPRYFAGGGMVTNNVGDIHVTVNGADTKSPARVGRAVGIEIRREIRRGNLR